MYIYTLTKISTYMYALMYIHTYTHTCIHTHTPTHKHTHIYTLIVVNAPAPQVTRTCIYIHAQK